MGATPVISFKALPLLPELPPDTVGSFAPSVVSVFFTLRLLLTVTSLTDTTSDETVPEPVSFALASTVSSPTVAPRLISSCVPSASGRG